MTTPLSSMLLVMGASVIGSFAAVALKHGADHLPPGILHVFVSWRIGMGVLLFMLSSVLFVAGLKHGSLTVLYPMVSLANVWTLVWSRLFFHEPFNRPKLLGLALILVGVFFIGLGNK